MVRRGPSEKMNQRDRLSTKKGIASAKILKKELMWHIRETVRKPMWLDWKELYV